MEIENNRNNVLELRSMFLQKLRNSPLSLRDNSEDEIGIASCVCVVDSTLFTKVLLGLDDSEYNKFNEKVEHGEQAIVFEIEDDEWCSIFYKDNLEVKNIHVLTLLDCIPLECMEFN